MNRTSLIRTLLALSAMTCANLTVGGTGWASSPASAAVLSAAITGPTPPAPAGAGIPFLPVTLSDLGPEGTNNPNVTWLAISGDWVAYTLSYVWCGHCQLYARTVYLHNTLTGQVREVRTSVAVPDTSSISAGGATGFRLAGGRLYWQQPAEPLAPPQYLYPYRLEPGTYTCAQCVYDPTAGTGGPWSGGTPPADPSGPWQAAAQSASQRPYTSTLTITDTLGSTVRRVDFGPGEHVSQVVTGGDQLAYVQLSPNPKTSYLDLQAVQYARLGSLDDVLGPAWARADAAVAAGTAPRSWLWGPRPWFHSYEAYAEGPNGRHEVLYYDKARMEVNDFRRSPSDPYYVTNGLLAVELISGHLQVGDTATITARVPCTIPVAGDLRSANPLTPDYAALAGVTSLHGDHQAPNRVGQPVDQALEVHGVVSAAPPAQAALSRYAAFVPQTGHNIPDVFWPTLTAMHATYGTDWTAVLGYPITEGYWTQMRVRGEDSPVLVQAFQRRVLTYVPGNAPEWRVQQGNVGQHYLEWRYTLVVPVVDR